MTIDYLDPYRPVESTEHPPEPERRSPENEETVRDDRPAERPPEHRDDTDGYDDHGETIDEYA